MPQDSRMDGAGTAPDKTDAQPRPRRSGNAADRIFEAIGNDIVGGILTSGQKLSEPELARRFGTSRGPVREAIRRLEERNLVERQPNYGPRVALFSPHQIIDLYYVREALEGMAARLAARYITEAELAEARQILDHQTAVWENREPGEMRYRRANIAFHEVVHRASRNESLLRQLRDDWHQLSRLWRRQHPEHPMRGREAINDHYRVLDALERRDEELAEIVMRRHIAATRRSYEAIIAERDSAGLEGG